MSISLDVCYSLRLLPVLFGSAHVTRRRAPGGRRPAHTHERMVRGFEGITIINAGTLHDTGPAGFVMVDFDALEVRCWDFDGEHAKAAEPVALP